MSPHDTVAVWIEQLKAGDSQAAQKLWEAYFQQMVDLARRKLEGARRGVADEEDVALSAFKSFCLAARNGKFTQLVDRANLWPLLMAITANKSVDLIRHENRQKRGGAGADSDASQPPAQLMATPLSDIISHDPTPEFAAQLAEQFDMLLARLDATGDADLRTIAVLKMEGHGNAEIAKRLGCVRRTIERKLQLIERLWGKDARP
ncbi:MAG: ECF-type sigma factor [Pirellulaceae bacterium]|nr:hypothetical protein [Planctomycetales bacterium]